jgi:L-asparaginase II
LAPHIGFEPMMNLFFVTSIMIFTQSLLIEFLGGGLVESNHILQNIRLLLSHSADALFFVGNSNTTFVASAHRLDLKI